MAPSPALTVAKWKEIINDQQTNAERCKSGESRVNAHTPFNDGQLSILFSMYEGDLFVFIPLSWSTQEYGELFFLHFENLFSLGERSTAVPRSMPNPPFKVLNCQSFLVKPLDNFHCIYPSLISPCVSPWRIDIGENPGARIGIIREIENDICIDRADWVY